MANKSLHIVSFDVPFPPNYGGAIDVFYKIDQLSKAGVKIYLHCYEYGRGQQPILDSMATKVFYYPRKTGIWANFSLRPYIVKSRRNLQLINNIEKIKAPILLEGIHCTDLLNEPKLIDFDKHVRMHNIENRYYLNLACKEKSIFKKLFFYLESIKLKRYEHKLTNYRSLIAISNFDYHYFKNKTSKLTTIGPSHQNTRVNIKEGKGEYILYHGNFTVVENLEAARYIIDKIAGKCSHSFVFAGKKANSIQKNHDSLPNIQFVNDPDHPTMETLIQNAQINLLPTFIQSGMKLKLLNALFNGRYVLANGPMVDHTGLENACKIFNSPKEALNLIENYINVPFTLSDIENRKKHLHDFLPENTTRKWMELIFVK